MQRSIFTVLSALLLSAAVTPAAKAQTPIASLTTFNPSVANTISANQVTPFDLAYLAYRGYLRDQDIPSGNTLISALETGEMSAKDIVQRAVKANRLPQQTLADKGYLNALADQLRAFEED